jgi:hypothetical protein
MGVTPHCTAILEVSKLAGRHGRLHPLRSLRTELFSLRQGTTNGPSGFNDEHAFALAAVRALGGAHRNAVRGGKTRMSQTKVDTTALSALGHNFSGAGGSLSGAEGSLRDAIQIRSSIFGNSNAGSRAASQYADTRDLLLTVSSSISALLRNHGTSLTNTAAMYQTTETDATVVARGL